MNISAYYFIFVFDIDDSEKRIIRLHVKGLPPKITEKEVEDRFKSFGKVHSIDLIPHPFEGKNEYICLF